MRVNFTLLLGFCFAFNIFDSGGVLINVRNSEDSLILISKDFLAKEIAIGLPHAARKKRSVSDSLEFVFFRIQTDIRYRYSRTYITSHVVNRDSKKSTEVTFQVVLPETAFISKFAMEIDGKTYEAYIKEKDEAKRVYDHAQSQGQSAGLVALNTRHSNVFNVNVNIKANSIINFNLTYEELLTRRLGRYEQVININGDQIANVQDAEVQVAIEESQPLTLVRVPDLRNELEVQGEDETSNKDAVIVKPTPNRAKITYRPSSKDSKLSNGKMGQFVVQYEIQRESDSGEVLIMNGYFVHFFAPPNLKPLPKHITFVLDISGSMSGRKIEQLRAAMTTILSDLSKDDYLNIIIFSTDVVSWAPGDTFEPSYQYGRSFPVDKKPGKRRPHSATSENIAKAKDYISSLQATGSTNIHDALIEALALTAAVRRTRDESGDDMIKKNSEHDHGAIYILPGNVESLIMFLTDGEPTVGVTDPTQIQTLIQAANQKNSIPIFSLAFGSGADFPFLRKLSLQNHGFARKIYEAADAELQLQGFYKEIASPLLSNVKFNYTSPESKYTVSEVTRRRFPTHFGGTEIAVAGRMDQKDSNQDEGMKSEAKVAPPTSFTMEHRPLVRYIPTDNCYFYSHIRGHGHGGRRQWVRPMMYIWRPPWWCHPPHPIPTTTTTMRPLPESSLEDTFLERLWAYLTIQQLIEQDFAEVKDQKESGSSKETKKQRALRLALKYGFVTPLTSLVVVKPTSEDVTDARSTDSKPEPFASSPGGGSGGGGGGHHIMRHSKMNVNGFSGNSRPMALGPSPSASGLSMRNIDGAASILTPVQSQPAPPQPIATDLDSDDDQGDKAESSKSKASKKADMAPSTTMRATTTSEKRSKKLKLADITWLNDNRVTIKQQEYTVAREDENVGKGKQQECNIGSGGSPLNKTKGKCRHLKDCVQTEFLDDFSVYEESYFCPIEIKGDDYAGVCCVKRNK